MSGQTIGEAYLVNSTNVVRARVAVMHRLAIEEFKRQWRDDVAHTEVSPEWDALAEAHTLLNQQLTQQQSELAKACAPWFKVQR